VVDKTFEAKWKKIMIVQVNNEMLAPSPHTTLNTPNAN
jgi:hypothetical protein